MTDIILQLCNITVHSFQVHGHYSFLSLSFLSWGPLTEFNYFPSYVGLHPTVVSTRLIPSGRACLGMPAHHACSTYVLSLHPRFNLWYASTSCLQHICVVSAPQVQPLVCQHIMPAAHMCCLCTPGSTSGPCCYL